MNEEPKRRMEWESAAESLLQNLLAMVPEVMKSLAGATARDESEIAAQERGADAVAGEDVIRGWIRTTPPEQRDGLVEVIDGLGFEAESFVDDLQSLEGWADGEEE